MARIISPTEDAPKPTPLWRKPGAEVLVIALDSNEVAALVMATRAFHKKACENAPTMPASSLNGAGARVFEALSPVARAKGYH